MFETRVPLKIQRSCMQNIIATNAAKSSPFNNNRRTALSTLEHSYIKADPSPSNSSPERCSKAPPIDAQPRLLPFASKVLARSYLTAVGNSTWSLASGPYRTAASVSFHNSPAFLLGTMYFYLRPVSVNEPIIAHTSSSMRSGPGRSTLERTR